MQCNDRFFALLRNYGDFAIAALNVKDTVTWVALGEDGFALSVVCEGLSPFYFSEKGFKVEGVLVLGFGHDRHYHIPDIWPSMQCDNKEGLKRHLPLGPELMRELTYRNTNRVQVCVCSKLDS